MGNLRNIKSLKPWKRKPCSWAMYLICYFALLCSQSKHYIFFLASNIFSIFQAAITASKQLNNEKKTKRKENSLSSPFLYSLTSQKCRISCRVRKSLTVWLRTESCYYLLGNKEKVRAPRHYPNLSASRNWSHWKHALDVKKWPLLHVPREWERKQSNYSGSIVGEKDNSGPKWVNKLNFRDKQGVIWAQPKLV